MLFANDVADDIVANSEKLCLAAEMSYGLVDRHGVVRQKVYHGSIYGNDGTLRKTKKVVAALDRFPQ